MESTDKPGKFSKEASFQVQTPKGVRCMICPNECSIREGEAGNCGNRRNFNGKLYSVAYGNPCSVHIDPVEKKPLLHFYPQSLCLFNSHCRMQPGLPELSELDNFSDDAG